MLVLLLLLLLVALFLNNSPAAALDTQEREGGKGEREGKSRTDGWALIGMPRLSYFAGFDAPNDAARWSRAVEQAQSGKQILLQKVLTTIRCPGDLLTGEKKFKWIHRIADVFVNRDSGFAEPLKNFTGYRAPITMIGYKLFDRKNWEGSELRSYTYIPKVLLQNLKKGKERFPRKFVAIGNPDENWGWLSTHFLNRTASWGFTYSRRLGPMRANQLEEISSFLDDPRVIMLLVNQHHNVSHPKVISLPRGVLPDVAKIIWDESQRVVRMDVRKDTLLFVASSNWGPRPMIIECVRSLMQGHLSVGGGTNGRLDNREFMKKMSGSMAVLCVPGLGYDTFRLWEALASGSMPVLERGVGFDRSLYKLPALLVDDFADLTPSLVKQAYVEALYRADDWDYKRMTTRWWERLLYKVSETGSISHLSRLHPIFPENSLFTRPMVPFDCIKIGGCGHGTKRVPKRSCAIDFDANYTSYNWYWEQNLQWPGGYPIQGHHLFGKVDPASYIEPPEEDEDVPESQNSENEAHLPQHRIPAKEAIKRIRLEREKKTKKGVVDTEKKERSSSWHLW